MIAFFLKIELYEKNKYITMIEYIIIFRRGLLAVIIMNCINMIAVDEVVSRTQIILCNVYILLHLIENILTTEYELID